jgi:hypothetical protein
MRFRRGQHKTNILSLNMLDYAMDRMFLIDLQKQFRHLSKQSIAEDLLNGAFNREALSKAMSDISADIPGSKAFAMSMALKHRQYYDVKPKGFNRRPVRQAEIEKALKLLSDYGVIFDD